jgi:hypothetical protein
MTIGDGLAFCSVAAVVCTWLWLAHAERKS